MVRVGEGLALLSSSRCSDSNLCRRFSTRQIVTVKPPAGEDFSKSTGTAENSGAREHGLSAEFIEE